VIRVDRLVLDVPGMSPGRAGRLSARIGAMLGESGPSEATDALDIKLPPGAATDEAILAALAAALRSRGA
jgi:hypothetical protein